MCSAAISSIKVGKARRRYVERGTHVGICGAVGDRSLALRIEYRVKQLTKRQKERLVEGEGLEALLSSLQAPDVKND
jgi:predicted GIY-YIG superfamily endonuclease